MSSPIRVAIVQPAVPQYRVPFFTRLITDAEKDGIHIDVFAGKTPTEIRARGDASDSDFFHRLSTHELRIRRRSLFYKSTTPVLRGGYDLVILEHGVRNMETYELLIRLGGQRIAFWGHGRTYTKSVSLQQEWFKYWLGRRATWFFGYTERGVDAVVAQDFVDVGRQSFDAVLCSPANQGWGMGVVAGDDLGVGRIDPSGHVGVDDPARSDHGDVEFSVIHV